MSASIAVEKKRKVAPTLLNGQQDDRKRCDVQLSEQFRQRAGDVSEHLSDPSDTPIIHSKLSGSCCAPGWKLLCIRQ